MQPLKGGGKTAKVTPIDETPQNFDPAIPGTVRVRPKSHHSKGSASPIEHKAADGTRTGLPKGVGIKQPR